MKKRFERQRREKLLRVVDLQNRARQTGREKAEIGRRRQARLRIELQSRKLPNDALDIFPAIFPRGKMHRANSRRGRLDLRREGRGVMEQNFTGDFLLSARARFNDQTQTPRQPLARGHSHIHSGCSGAGRELEDGRFRFFVIEQRNRLGAQRRLVPQRRLQFEIGQIKSGEHCG